MSLVGRRRALRLGLAAVWVVHASTTSAQGAGGITGRVLDVRRNPVADAVVTIASFDLPNREASPIIDSGGSFELEPAPPGRYDVFVAANAFRPGEVRDVRVEEGRMAAIEIVLDEIVLDEIVLERRDGSAGY